MSDERHLRTVPSQLDASLSEQSRTGIVAATLRCSIQMRAMVRSSVAHTLYDKL
jgi:hypothetical protein